MYFSKIAFCQLIEFMNRKKVCPRPIKTSTFAHLEVAIVTAARNGACAFIICQHNNCRHD